MIDWFAIGFGLLGIVNILSGCYEWKWWWRLARGFYLPELVGLRTTRLIYMSVGGVMLAIGTALFLQNLFHSTSIIYWVIGVMASSMLPF